MDKRIYILETIRLMQVALDDPLMTTSLDRISSTVAHTAPEIISQRWTEIFLFCKQWVQDGENPKHMKCFKIYHERLKGYKELSG